MYQVFNLAKVWGLISELRGLLLQRFGGRFGEFGLDLAKVLFSILGYRTEGLIWQRFGGQLRNFRAYFCAGLGSSFLVMSLILVGKIG